MIGGRTVSGSSVQGGFSLLGLLRADRGALLIVVLFLLLLPISNPRVALSDEVQYYAYLRSVYFDGDLDFANEYEHFANAGLANNDRAVYNALLRQDRYNPNPITGLLRNVAPVGSAIMWSPGFILADVGVRLANMLGAEVEADGYSRPYIWAACLMSALYSLLGLLLTYRLARRFVGVFAATAATVTVWLASPLVFYTYIAMPWSHATAFFLFSLFLTLWLGSGDRPAGSAIPERSLRRWALLGLIGGLLTVTREQLGLLMLIPAVEGLEAYIRMFRARRWPEIKRLLAGHAVFLAVLVLALLPQLVAYQILNGRPGPSATVAGKLNPLSPRFLHTLLDPAHGAFLWSPVLGLGLLGLGLLARRNLRLAALLLIGFLGQTYINGAFGSTWHLSGSFGFRRLIECTPIFVVGLACLFDALRPRLRRWPLLVLAALLIYWNVGLIAQWAFVRKAELRKGLVWDGMVRYQFVEVPQQVAGKFDQLLFNRCALMTNCGKDEK